MFNYTIPENGHIVNCLPATKSGGAADYTGDVFCLKNYAAADILISFGATAATSTIMLYECTSAAAASATAIAFDYYSETTAAGDTLSERTTATSAGIATSANDDIMYVIPIDSSQLSQGYEWIRLNVNVGGVNSVCAIAVLHGARYAGATTPTAIA